MRTALVVAVMVLVAGCGRHHDCPIAFDGTCRYTCPDGTYGTVPVESCGGLDDPRKAFQEVHDTACSGAEPVGFYCQMDEVPAP